MVLLKYICALAMRQYHMFILLQEVRKYKSCGIFISFVLLFEHCYFVDNCQLSGKIGPNKSTKKFLSDNSPIRHGLHIP